MTFEDLKIGDIVYSASLTPEGEFSICKYAVKTKTEDKDRKQIIFSCIDLRNNYPDICFHKTFYDFDNLFTTPSDAILQLIKQQQSLMTGLLKYYSEYISKN